MRIGFLPDLVLSEKIDLDASIKAILKSNDINIANLEAAVYSKFKPRQAIGVKLFFDENYLTFLKDNKISSVSLANNHIMDYGVKGLHNTMDVLRRHNISFFGVGDNIHEAIQPFIFTADNLKIGIFGFSFLGTNSIDAKENSPGCAPFSLSIMKSASNLFNTCDYKIAVVHCGEEYVNFPEPYIKHVYDSLLESGYFNLIFGSHAHTLQGIVKKDNGNFGVFGAGNFSIPEREYYGGPILYHEESEYGMFLVAEFNENCIPNFHKHFYKIEQKGKYVRMLTSKELANISRLSNEYSRPLINCFDDYFKWYKNNINKNNKILINSKSDFINSWLSLLTLKTHQINMYIYHYGRILKRSFKLYFKT